jgi:chemotaxis protein methyltransferase CheR
MTEDDFDRLQALLASRAGYRLGRDRMHLAEHRLGPVARREGFDSVEALLQSLWVKPVASLGWAVIEALLNAETWFRRDRAVFDTISRELLPAIARVRPGGRVTLWSAGCSTGQEAYSLAIGAQESGVAVDIVATDLSQRAIDKARSGLFSAFEIQRGLSARVMLEWFQPAEDAWTAVPRLKDAVRFARHNLLDAPTDGARFDVILCRNVLSEMDPAQRGRVVDHLERRLADDGVLILGAEERIEADTVAFRPVAGRKGLYVKTPATLSRAA